MALAGIQITDNLLNNSKKEAHRLFSPLINSSAPNEHSNRQIAQKTAWGFIWNFSSYFLGKFVVLITTSILARLLAKSDFGLDAIAVVLLIIFPLKELGLGVALVQRKGDVKEAAKHCLHN